MIFRNITILFAGALLLLASCDDTTNDPTSKPAGDVKERPTSSVSDIRLSEAELTKVTEDLGYYFASMSEGRFEEYVDMVYPGVWVEDSLKEKTIAMMEEYASKGFMNVTKDFNIKYASPLVNDSTMRVTLIIADMRHEVYLGEEFRQSAAELEPMIRSQYGEGQYRYVPDDNKYEIEGIAKFYAITPNDSLSFTFLNEQFAQSRYLGRLLQYNTVIELKKFESEVL